MSSGLHIGYGMRMMFDMRRTNADSAPLEPRALRLLERLLETASVTRAGEALGLSQPAASRAVAALRRALGDPLVVRTAKGYVPTARGLALRGPVAEALAALARVSASAAFDPSRTTRTFRLATTDYGAGTVLAALGPLFAAHAPLARLDAQAWTDTTLADLEGGALDAALYADAPLPPDFHARDLFRDDYVVLAPKDHPAVRGKGKERLDMLRRARRVVILYPDGRRLAADDALGDLGAPEDRIAIRTPYFASAPALLRGGDLVLALPRRAARALIADSDLAVLPLPAVPRFTYRLIWHARTHRDPAHRWLRDMVRQAVGQ